MNLLHGKAKDGACPRPLSRKKLRQLMPHNHRNLTAHALAAEFGREPGYGRTRVRLKSERDRLKKIQERDPNSFTATALAVLTQLTNLFVAKQRRANIRRAQ